MEFRQAVIDSFDRIEGSGFIVKAIEEKLQSTVKSLVADALGEYSDFGTELKELVKKSLAIHGDLDLPTYNDLLLKIIRRQVETATHASIEKQVAERMSSLLEAAPETITLSELVEKYRDHVRDRNSCVCFGDDHRITLHVNEDDLGFRKIRLDAEPNKRPNECDIYIGTHQGEVYHLQFQRGDLEKQLFAGPFHGFEKLLFQMKAARSRIEFDVDPSDIELSYETADI